MEFRHPQTPPETDMLSPLQLVYIKLNPAPIFPLLLYKYIYRYIYVCICKQLNHMKGHCQTFGQPIKVVDIGQALFCTTIGLSDLRSLS